MRNIVKINKRVNDINTIMVLKNTETNLVVTNMDKKDREKVVLEIYAYIFDITKTYEMKLVMNRVKKENLSKVFNKNDLEKYVQIYDVGHYTFSQDGFKSSTDSMINHSMSEEIGFSEGAGGLLTINFTSFYDQSGSYEFYLLLDDKILSVFPFDII